MTTQNSAAAKRIANEYIDFTRKVYASIEEVKRATVLSLKKVLNLEDGDCISIKEDGFLEIETKNTMGGGMPENKNNEQEVLKLNGRDTTPDELQRQREAIKKQEGAKLEEVTKGNFRLRLTD